MSQKSRLNRVLSKMSGINCILAGLVLLFVFTMFGVSPVSAADESISVTISGNPTVNIIPNSEGTFADSGSVTIGVTTTNATGYSLSIAAQDSTNLKGKNDNTQIISTLEAAVSPSDFSTSEAYNNRWGYKPNQYYNTNTQTVIQNTNYLPSPTTEGTTLDVTSTAGSKNYTMSIGARVTNATKFDEYSNTFVITAIANVVPLTVVFDANGGSFSGGGTTNTMGVKMNCTSEPPETVTKYAHTPNVSDAGIASTTYSNNMDTTDIVTIDGAETLNVTVYYDAESTSYDWVSVYQSPFNISTSNDDTISTSTGNLSGKLSGRNSSRTTSYSSWYSQSYTVTGDIVRFHFKSDTSGTYYGYYAVVTGTGEGPTTCNNTVTSGTYKKPTSGSSNFVGWATSSASTVPIYGPDIDLTTEYLGENDSTVTLHAVYAYYMQDVSSWRSKLANTGDEVLAIDKRDNKFYTVAKMADGNIWMNQDLDLELDSSTSLTSEDTDLNTSGSGAYSSGYSVDSSTGVISWTPASTATTANHTINGTSVSNWSNNNTAPYSVEGGDVYYYTSGTTDNDTTYDSLATCKAEHTEAECKHYHRGNYYNWTAAIASNASSSISTQYNVAANSVCPKGWRLPKGEGSSDTADTAEFAELLRTSGVISSRTTTSYSTDGFNKIRSTPLYLVRLGRIESSTLVGSAIDGNYWSSTVYSGNGAYNLSFSNGGTTPRYRTNRYYGFPVRCLARDPYMQDVDEWKDSLSTGQEVAAIDKRDNKTYTVAKMADGNIWMNQNLDLELSSSTPLTSENTDLNTSGSGAYSDGYSNAGGTISWTPATTANTSGHTISGTTVSGWTNNNSAPYSAEGGDVYVYTSGSTSSDMTYNSLSACISAGHTEADCKHYHRGNYYNWSATIASNDSTDISVEYSSAANSICPKGWRLPKGQLSSSITAVTVEFAELLRASGIISSLTSATYATSGFINVRAAQLFFVRSGGIFSSTQDFLGESSRYWSSTIGSSDMAHSLDLAKGYLDTKNKYSRGFGFSVRCLAPTS